MHVAQWRAFSSRVRALVDQENQRDSLLSRIPISAPRNEFWNLTNYCQCGWPSRWTQQCCVMNAMANLRSLVVCFLSFLQLLEGLSIVGFSIGRSLHAISWPSMATLFGSLRQKLRTWFEWWLAMVHPEIFSNFEIPTRNCLFLIFYSCVTDALDLLSNGKQTWFNLNHLSGYSFSLLSSKTIAMRYHSTTVLGCPYLRKLIRWLQCHRRP